MYHARMSLPSRPAVELLAPAGEPRALRAALAAGADAVYFGLERFSARAFAGNFAGEGAVEAVELAHAWGANAYLALNTLLKDDEVEPALAALEAPYRAGLDALIVADLGFAALVRAQYPRPGAARQHAAQHPSSAQLAALAGLGFAWAVLARELSLAEIAALQAHGLELEAFVHGPAPRRLRRLPARQHGGRTQRQPRPLQPGLPHALRASSRGAGRASAADARRPAWGSPPPRRPCAAPMSTADLAAIGVLPGLIAAGATSLKIEGRMKDAAYVAVTTAVYREALEQPWPTPKATPCSRDWLARLEQSFSRGFTTAHLEGRHHEVRSGGRGGHRGVAVGRVRTVDEGAGLVTVRLSQPLMAGDLVCLYTPWGQSEELRVEHDAAAEVTLCVRERVAVKDRLFRLAAAEVDEVARDLVAARRVLRPLPLRLALRGDALGEPAHLSARSGEEAPVSVSSAAVLAPARPWPWTRRAWLRPWTPWAVPAIGSKS